MTIQANPELILLARNMRYEIEITHRKKKNEKKLQSSRPDNLILKDKKKTISKNITSKKKTKINPDKLD
jgi:hypothetical protein